ncbi:hypothetical protein [Deinococcus sp.]|uniref:hypothetical protein n=1 Tax=Deinococcus sp. TaxID=47478 RepID=UPI0025C61692|nr:hypothetical protein [Deinococcus sp.]
MASLYTILLALHNINRWLVLLTGIWAVVQNISVMGGGRPFTPSERRPVATFVGTLHLQVVLGLGLYALMGMQHMTVFPGVRPSFGLEHMGMGLLAAIFATVGSIQSRKAATEQAKGRAAVIWCGLALLILLAAIPWFRRLLPF